MVVTIVLGFVMTTIILKVLDGLMGLRVSDEDEQAGLDLSQHSETAYALGGGDGVFADGRQRRRLRGSHEGGGGEGPQPLAGEA